MKMLEKALSDFERKKEKHLEDLKNLVRIPSVSFEGFPLSEVKKSAIAVSELFKETGLENIQILEAEPNTPPYVYADWLHAPGKPTLLLYAHHDVQPPGRTHLWKSAPFEPTIRDGRIFGRGTADDKAGVVVHTAAIASYLKTSGKLPLNIKLIIEGEEEIGSIHLKSFLEKHKKLLQADAMILTDTQNYDVGVPAITTSLRGLITFDLELSALNSPKHSGMWGGPVPDAAMAMSKVLSTFTDKNGKLNVPGIWDEVRKVTAKEEDAYNELPMTEEEFRLQSGLLPNSKTLPSSDGKFKPLIQMWREPSFAINAIEASSRAQASNIIVDSCWARFGVRIVPNMDPKRTAKLIEDHIRSHVPWGCEIDLKTDVSGGAWGTEVNGPAFEAALIALERGYNRKPVIMGCGGSIPFVEPMAEALGGIPALLIGVEDPYTNAHSENESMVIDDFEKCIRSAIHFYSIFSGASS